MVDGAKVKKKLFFFGDMKRKCCKAWKKFDGNQ